MKTGRIELLDGIINLKDYPLVVALTAGTTGLQWWLMYAKERIGLTLGGGCTGDAAMQVYPFLQSGQLCGLVPGIKGAAEYETLLDPDGVDAPGPATRRMVPQTVGHGIIILFVILGNLAYLAGRKRGGDDTDGDA